MAQKWSNVVIQILLKGNFMVGAKAALAADYNPAVLLTDTIMRDAATQFPFTAVLDKILQAMAMIVTSIGENRESEYRSAFLFDTADIPSGGLIPLTASSKPRFGVVSDFKDSVNSTYLTKQPREIVLNSNRAHARRTYQPYYYFTDDVRVWHSRTNVKAEVVAWDKTAERAVMIASNHTSDCPLPEDLLPMLELGSLAFIHRDSFNMEQAVKYQPLFLAELARISGKPAAVQELAAKQ